MFADRIDAGRQLAQALAKYRAADAVVYALPRGGVVLGYEVATALGAPLDLAIARKIGHPHNPEYAVCAVTEDGPLICDEAELGFLDKVWLAEAVERERQEAKRRRAAYLTGRSRISPAGKTAILVDDGIATGLTIRAALASLRKEKPAKVVVAVPCAGADVTAMLRREADEVIVLTNEEEYQGAVGAYYEKFPQVTDAEVIALLAKTV